MLLGDHYQLGPVVLMQAAESIGQLGRSMLERVANERFLAVAASEGKEGLSKDTLTLCEERGIFFLTESYRSHPDIMSLYSGLFYADQLDNRPLPRHGALEPFFAAKGLPSPVLLHNVVGEELRDPGSASAYNIEEVRVIQDYIYELLSDESLGLSPRDIGVIAPYARQVKLLREQVRRWGPELAGVEVIL